MTSTAIHALVLAALSTGPSAPAPTDVFEQAMESALERAQRRLESSLELYQDHSTWETAWEVRTRHYAVRATESFYRTRNLADGLESMLGHFQSVMGRDHEPSEPWAIFVFPTLTQYNTFANDFGADHSSFYGSFFSGADDDRAVAAYANENETLTKMWVTHAAFHQWIASAFNREAPTWLVEGLASYFALYWDRSYGPSELARLQRAGRLRPLAGVLRDGVTAYAPDPHDRFIQLGMLMTYLLHYREDTRTVGDVPGPFAEYLNLRMVVDDFRLHPVHELLTDRVAELEADFLAFEFPR